MAKLLQQYEESFAEVNWKAITQQEKLDFVFRWFELKIFDAKLNKAKTTISNEEQEAAMEQYKQSYIKALQQVGFVCDNSIDDYYKLFNRPEIFGENWKARADFEHSQSTGIDSFINITRNYL